MTLRFRTKIFVASLGVAAAALALATIIIARELRSEERALVEQRLREQTLLLTELLSQHAAVTGAGLDDEADRLSQLIDARVTLIAPDGRVVGDSTADGEALAALENHRDRPEVQEAGVGQVAVVERYSTTVQTDLLYAAVRARHPEVAYVRVALPLTAVAARVRRVGMNALLAFALAAPVAVVLAWLSSVLISRRVQAIAEMARQYGDGNLTRPAHDYGRDELGAVARVLDTSVQELGRRLEELSRDRARMEAMLSGMVEGVLVLDRQGRVQLVNRAAQAMLHGGGARVPGGDQAPGHLGAARGGPGRRGGHLPRAGARTRSVAPVRGARGTGGGRGRRRRARPARHDGPAPRGSDPARLRRQRLA